MNTEKVKKNAIAKNEIKHVYTNNIFNIQFCAY